MDALFAGEISAPGVIPSAVCCVSGSMQTDFPALVRELVAALRHRVARRWVAVVLFKLNWLLLVAGQQRWLLLVLCSTLPLQLLAVLPATARAGQAYRVLRPCLLFACLGLIVDQALSFAGVLLFPGRWLPIWLPTLWLAFALVLPHLNEFLQRLPVYAWSVLGAIGGIVSYQAGAALGAVTLGQPLWLSSMVLALVWALLLPAWRTLALRGLPRAGVSPVAASVAWLLLLLCGTPAPAVAAEGDLALVGTGHYRFLAWPIYDATLKAARQPFDFPGTVPFELSLEYKRAFSAEQIIAETRRQWSKQDVDVVEEWQHWLQQSIPDVAAGDSLTLHVDARHASHFFHNGSPTRTIDDPGFTHAFAGIWLAANTSAPRLRAQLLGDPR